MNGFLNNSKSKQFDILVKIINENKFIEEILATAAELNLTDWYVGAGCIAQTVWNKFHDFPPNKNINDIDFVYYDSSDLSYESENDIIKEVRDKYEHIPVPVDVKNQARVHLWYEKHFGYKIEQYKSLNDAIKTWPTTATSIGIRKEENEYIVYSPFGLNDLLNQVVRANKTQITEEIFLKKVERWKKCWPGLTVIPWANS